MINYHQKEIDMNQLIKRVIVVVMIILTIASCVENEVTIDNNPSSHDTKTSIVTKAYNDNAKQYSNLEFQFNYVDSISSSRVQNDTLENGIILQKEGDHWLFEGDIVIDDRNMPLFEEMGLRSAVRTEAQYYWPMRIVYYKYDASFTSNYQSVAEAAMSLISNACGVSFEPAGSINSNYVLFKYSSTGNNSSLGMVGGEQIINIHSCYTDVIAHEIMHALGFFHEHSRVDRDSYIIVNYDNIRPAYRYAFKKYTERNIPGMDLDTFDFYSIMLYDSYITDLSFVYDDNIPVITKLDGSTFWGGITLSSGDINGLKSVYGPPYHRLETRDIEEITDYESDYEEIYEVEREACIKFYSTLACSTRMQTTLPRKMVLRKYIQSCSTYGQMVCYTQDQAITVPAGVDSVFVDDYINYEHYLYSNPLQVNTIEYGIVNSHVAGINY